MAEESDLERSYHPTPRRLLQAREKGQVARSRELSTAVTVLTAALFCWWVGPTLTGRVHDLIESGLRLNHAHAFDTALLAPRLFELLGEAVLLLLPLFAILLIADILAPLLIGGWNFSLKALQPDFNRLSPLKGFARIFSKHGLVELVKALAKCVIIGSVAVWFMWHHWSEVQGIAQESMREGVAHTTRLTVFVVLCLGGGLTLIALFDVPYQLWHYYSQLKMNRQELKEEAKETEGDPQIRGRIRSQQRELARKRMMEAVPKADVVVTNPMHFAVALSYAEGKMGAPRVVAKGMQLLAQKIRDVAIEHQVPILEAPPLARALYRHTEIGQEIPQALYAAVAQVLAYVYQLRDFVRGGGFAPIVPTDLPVPSSLDPGELNA